MNIIEAIQQAENGALITNNFLKFTDSFLKYMGNGVFYQYKLVDDKPVYKYEVRDFSTAHVLSTGWEALQVNYFENEKSNEEKPSSLDAAMCQTCYYSSNGKHNCDRHINKLQPDYSKGRGCNNNEHYRQILIKTKNGLPEIDGMGVTFNTKAIRAEIESILETNKEFHLPDKYTYVVVNSTWCGKMAKIILKD